MEKTTTTNIKLPLLEKVLVVGNGGRENSLAWAIAKNHQVKSVFVAPGNGGTEQHLLCSRLNIKETNTNELISFCLTKKIDLVVIGGEKPLSLGLADEMRRAGLVVFGPGADGARLEASKGWAKELMVENGIPTAEHWCVSSEKEGLELTSRLKRPLVVKADGLAAGKGVTVATSIEETQTAIKEAFQGKFGQAGKMLVLEECLNGPEVSIFALCDGNEMTLLPSAQDHKRLLDGDKGPNTGGMGAYSPANVVNKEDLEIIKNEILRPTLKALKRKGINYRGVIYAGLMLTKKGPKVIEFNCRFGDPECQALMPKMGNEFAEVLLACALGSINRSKKLTWKKISTACVVATSYGYPENPRKGDEIKIKLPISKATHVFHSGTEKDNKGRLVTSGGRVLSIVSQAVSFDEAFEVIYKELEKIRFEGINYRNDIGNQVRSNYSYSD